jgi:hypothetical protein
VVVDRVVICTVVTPMAGFALVFGCYFMFNIAYPSEAGATLEYVQRYGIICNIGFCVTCSTYIFLLSHFINYGASR